jgi:hypothetical protein
MKLKGYGNNGRSVGNGVGQSVGKRWSHKEAIKRKKMLITHLTNSNGLKAQKECLSQ